MIHELEDCLRANADRPSMERELAELRDDQCIAEECAYVKQAHDNAYAAAAAELERDALREECERLKKRGDDANAAFAHCEASHTRLEQENERLRGALREIADYANCGRVATYAEQMDWANVGNIARSALSAPAPQTKEE